MRYLILLVLSLTLSGCGLLNFPLLNAPKPPDQVYSYHQTIEKEPKVIQAADGKSYVWEGQRQEVNVNYERKDKPLSWWQRLCNWLGNLGLLGILALLAGLVLAPAGTIGLLWKQYLKWKKALTQTVWALEETKVIDNSPQVKTALATSHDTETKKLIDDIKRSE